MGHVGEHASGLKRLDHSGASGEWDTNSREMCIQWPQYSFAFLRVTGYGMPSWFSFMVYSVETAEFDLREKLSAMRQCVVKIITTWLMHVVWVWGARRVDFILVFEEGVLINTRKNKSWRSCNLEL